jgi:hypothetical protein
MPHVAVAEEKLGRVQVQVWNSVDDAFLHLVSAYEALESFGALGGIEGFPMSFELAVGSVCTALVALDDLCDNVRRRPIEPCPEHHSSSDLE